MRMRLRSLTIRGFRSIDGVQGVTVSLAEDVTILLCAIGAGKSAVQGIFTLLRLWREESLPSTPQGWHRPDPALRSQDDVVPLGSSAPRR